MNKNDVFRFTEVMKDWVNTLKKDENWTPDFGFAIEYECMNSEVNSINNELQSFKTCKYEEINLNFEDREKSDLFECLEDSILFEGSDKVVTLVPYDRILNLKQI